MREYQGSCTGNHLTAQIAKLHERMAHLEVLRKSIASPALPPAKLTLHKTRLDYLSRFQLIHFRTGFKLHLRDALKLLVCFCRLYEVLDYTHKFPLVVHNVFPLTWVVVVF